MLIENIIRTDRNFVGRAAWSKASLEDISQYKCKLDDFLKTVHVPLEAVQCKDPKCDRHSENIDKFHKDIVGGCLQAAELSIPKTKKPNKHRIPGWNQFVKEKHWSALFWHERWKENGRPTEGEIAAVMRYTRHQYHYAVRHCKKNEVKIKATRMAEAMTNNHTRDFWAEVNKLNCSQRGVPETVDGVNDPNGIADLFFDKFKHLYSSVAYDNDKMDDFKRSLDTDIEWDYQKLVSDGSIVNVNDILKLTQKLKSGKSDGNRGLSSDCIIHGTQRLFVLLAMFYNSVLTHGHVPVDILLGTMTPIPKCNGVTHSSDKYRAITLSCVIGKILDLIILSRESSQSLNSDVLQFAFKEGHSTTLCTGVLQQCASYFLNGGSHVYALLLDVSKAFDRVEYVKLFTTLKDRGTNSIILRCLAYMYTNQVLRVSWNGHTSENFLACNGVKQGGVLSPILFGAYMDGLLSKLRESSNGCFVGPHFIGTLGYADDLCLLSPTIPGLEQMIDICTSYAEEYHILFNGAKSHLIRFCKKKQCSFCLKTITEIEIGGSTIKNEKSAIHLGHKVHMNLVDDSDSVYKSFYKQYNIFRTRFTGVQSLVKSKLFLTYCSSLYGIQICNISRV